jgi:hypothetical protein
VLPYPSPTVVGNRAHKSPRDPERPTAVHDYPASRQIPAAVFVARASVAGVGAMATIAAGTWSTTQGLNRFCDHKPGGPRRQVCSP